MQQHKTDECMNKQRTLWIRKYTCAHAYTRNMACAFAGCLGAILRELLSWTT